MAGFRVSKRRIFESNTLFDTKRGALRRTGRLLRVRQAGAHHVVTYKGAETAGKFKDREELELDIADSHKLTVILSRLDFVARFRYEKYRTEYQRPRETGVAMLDETPIGVYLELEGSGAWIDHTTHLLGFSESDYITTSYYGLYIDYCGAHHLQPADMTWGALNGPAPSC